MRAASTFQPGFECAEALAMMGLCQKVYEGPTHTVPDPTVGHFPAPPPPAGWKPVCQPSDVVGLDNYWELWSNTAAPGEFAIVVRGTVLSAQSIFEDIMVPMIPAQGSLAMEIRRPRKRVKKKIRYTFSQNAFAAVHLGFAIGALALLYQDEKQGIWAQMKQFAGARTRFFITGHSQGAAIATLVRSFLEHQPVGGLGPESYKTYVFAQPKPGNDQYGFDFDQRAAFPRRAFRVTNTEDWVAQVAPTLQWIRDISTPNPVSSLVGMAAMNAAVKPAAAATLTWLKGRARAKLIEAGVTMAGLKFRPSLNYDRCGSPVPLAGEHGTNPCNRSDMLWQHHLGMYRRLFLDQLGEHCSV